MQCAPTSENMGFLGGLALLSTIASLAPPVIATPIIESIQSMLFHQKLEHQVSAKASIAQQFQIQKHHTALSRSCGC